MASPSSPKKPTEQIETTNLLERLAQLLSQPLPPVQQQPSPLPVIIPATEGGIPSASIKFNGQNYGLWAQVVEMQLASKGKLGYIDGTLSPPSSTEEKFKKWKTEDSTVKSWLISSMDPNLIGNFIRFPSARDVWRAVEIAYLDRNDRSQVYNLKKQVARLKQSGKPIEEFYNSLQALWQEIDFRRSNPMECPKDIEKHNILLQEDRVYQFLDGLDDRFDKVRGEVLRMNPFPTVDEAFAVIRQEDSHQGAMRGKEAISAPMAMVVNTEKADAKLSMYKPNPYPMKARQPLSGGCTHCGGTKHTKETCFKLIGYPDWFRDPKKKKPVSQPPNDGNRSTAALASGSGVSLVPIVDGEKVTTEGNQCVIISKQVASRSNEVCYFSTSKPETQKHERCHSTMFFGPKISDNCYENHRSRTGLENKGVALSFSEQNNDTWIIDSGASDHMTFSPTDLHEQTEPRRKEIINANGVSSPVTGAGTVYISPAMTLSNTLLVPSLSTKLLSVGQICEERNCIVLM